MKNYIIIIMSTYLFLIACKRIEKANTANANSYEVQPCNLHKVSNPIRPEFKELESQLTDFYESKFMYDVIFIEKTTGKTSNDIFKRLSQDSLGNFTAILDGNSNANTMQLENKVYVNQLIRKIEGGHFIDDCKGFTSRGVIKLLLVKVDNEIKFSFSLSRNNLEDFSDEDKNKIENGYELATVLRKL